MSLIIRDATAQDVPFVYDSWIQSYRACNTMKLQHTQRYYEGQRGLIEKILRREGAAVKVATSSAEPDVILGWCCVEPDANVLHYVYVKHRARGCGVARMLLECLHGAVTYTHKTGCHAPRGWRWDPYMLME
jgi:GNAT superfamily N-acetyltransferase